MRRKVAARAAPNEFPRFFPVSGAMSDPTESIRAFLEGWKPFAALPPGNPARRGLSRLFESDDPAQRAAVLERVSLLFRLHGKYRQLEIHREEKNERGAQFQRMLRLTREEAAQALQSGNTREVLDLLQTCFEFGRHPAVPRDQAVRTFLLELWEMETGAPGMKFSIYPNGVLFPGKGLTHDEMARRFTELGYGPGTPQGGGEMLRKGQLEFEFDTASTAFGAGTRPEFVVQSVKRWIHATGGQEDKVTFAYKRKIGVE